MDEGTGLRAAVTARRRSLGQYRLFAVVLMLSLIAAACDSGAPPVNNPGGPGNQQPTLRPVTGALTDLLPRQVGDVTLEVQGGDGEAGLALLPNADVASIAEQVEKLRLTTDRLSVAVAGDIEAANDEEGLAVVAVRVPGVLFTPNSGPQATFVKSLLGITGAARTARATLANKTTTTLRPPSDGVSQTTYIYSPTEVIFIVRGPEAAVEEVFRQIPERP